MLESLRVMALTPRRLTNSVVLCERGCSQRGYASSDAFRSVQRSRGESARRFAS